jgi:hypothetical protein
MAPKIPSATAKPIPGVVTTPKDTNRYSGPTNADTPSSKDEVSTGIANSATFCPKPKEGGR